MSGLNDPRVLFAAERTLLAWTRTSLTLMGFGFLIERFGLFLHMLAGQSSGMSRDFSFWVGIVFIVLGVALTGSDTSSNVLFGNLQQISAQQLGISPLLAAASNSAGGVMGKMIDAQSIVVAGVATGQQGKEGEILRYVFFHSLVLAALVGVLVLAIARLFPGLIP
jgi:L-lactate permease